MRVRRLWPAALLLLTPVLTACGDDDPVVEDTPSPSATETSTPAEATSATTSAPAQPSSSAAAAGLPAACDLVTAEDLAEAYGMSFGAPEVGGSDSGSEGSTGGGLAWTSDDCSFEAEGLAEVTVKVTGPEDFTQGAFGCPQPSDDEGSVEPANDIAGATAGWWKVSSPPDFEGELRACSPKVLLQIDLDYEKGVEYEGDPLNQSVGLAEKLLAAIG
ncbi:hypothetical protein FHP29_14160 [Nocardioides albidus]|uniref:DUF3558 domain-containing protein n=1 Tax=Nocardioides albidus TaxID=1517589 RepID=A0A5C4VR79_9ACTN|nr:hypothetical protein [Nocardioides albidus]TNM38403.1 hypothetical protein FHP29_14160 [Nocardioides albidus]